MIAGHAGQPIFHGVLAGAARLWCLALSGDVFSLLIMCWVQIPDLKDG